MTILGRIAVGIGSALIISVYILALALCGAAARGDRMMEEIMRKKKGEKK